MNTKISTSVFLNTEATAKYLGISPKTLTRWRVEGRGPSFRRFGGDIRGRVLYHRDDLDTWAEMQRRISTAVPVS